MLLLGALFALFISGFWVYCLVDVALTPSNEFRRLPKWAWIAFVVVTFVIGAAIWLAVRRPAQPTAAPRPPGPRGTGNRGGGHPGKEPAPPARRPPPAGAEGHRNPGRGSPGKGAAAPRRRAGRAPRFPGRLRPGR